MSEPQANTQASSLTDAQPCCPSLAIWTECLAFAIALVAVAGSLYLTYGLGLRACPLCLYQRMFAMAVVAVFLAGWLFIQPPGRGLAALALPFGAGGLGVAAFHFSQEWSQKMVCPLGLFDWGTAPLQSLAIFSALTGVLMVSVMAAAKRSVLWNRGVIPVVILVVLGLATAGALITSSPPPASEGEYQDLVNKRLQHQLLICTPVKSGSTG